MGKLERLAAARERVREWKVAHPKSVEWQRKRWYARRKGERKVAVIAAAGRLRKAVPKEYSHYGELHTGPIEGVDVGYLEMEPKPDGGREEVLVKVPAAHQETENERDTYARLEELVARRAVLDKKEKGVRVELIL